MQKLPFVLAPRIGPKVESHFILAETFDVLGAEMSSFGNKSAMGDGGYIWNSSLLKCKSELENPNIRLLNSKNGISNMTPVVDYKLLQGNRKQSALDSKLISNEETSSFSSCSKESSTQYELIGDNVHNIPKNLLSASVPEFIPRNGLKSYLRSTKPTDAQLSTTSDLRPSQLAYKLGNEHSFWKEPTYRFVQEYGQLKYGPPPGWSGPPPQRGCEVFVGHIPKGVKEEELLTLFQSASVVYEFRSMVRFSRDSWGYAFVKYTNQEDAKTAIRMFDGFEIRPNKRIGVLKSRDNYKLFIGGVPTRKTNVQVYEEMKKYTDGVVRVVLYPNSADPSRNRGFCFVEYESHRAAGIARRVLIGEDIQLWNKKVKVEWAEMEPDVDEDCLKEVTSLYVRNIPQRLQEDKLLEFFSLEGRLVVQKVKRIKDFAFVHYFTRDAAEKALLQFNGINLGGNKIEVTWAKPRIQKFSSVKTFKSDLRQELKDAFSDWIAPSYGYLDHPVQVLQYICMVYGYGEPIYHITHSVQTSSNPNITFTAQVLIPNWPLPVQYFMADGNFCSPYEAKQQAALFALKSLGQYNNAFTSPVVPNEHHPRFSSTSSSYNLPLNYRSRKQAPFPDLKDSPLNDELSGEPDNDLDLLQTAIDLVNIYYGITDPDRKK